jgi:hypothetical protein
VKLKVAERLILLNLLPQEGDIVTLRVVRDAQQVIGLSEEELAELNIHHPEKEDGTEDIARLIWKAEADVEKDIPIGPRATIIIIDKLTKLSEEKKLTVQQIGLYEKFVDPQEPEEDIIPFKKGK